MPPKKGAAKAAPVESEVINDILARLAKLEKWRAEWKERKANKKKKKNKDKKRKREEEEEQVKKKPKVDEHARSKEAADKVPPNGTTPQPQKITAAKSKPKAKAKALPALPAPPVKIEASSQAMQDPPASPAPAAAKPAEDKGSQASNGKADLAADAGNHSQVQAIPADPRAANCCYDTLKIARDASIEEVKRAYRSLAIRMHPDKGGDHKAFCGLQIAFETLQDEVERKAYDRELRSCRSRDGTLGATDDGPVAQSLATSPFMLRDALMGADPKQWAFLLKELSDSNLKTLQDFLSSSKEEINALVKQLQADTKVECPSKQNKGVEGLIKHGHKYAAKVSFSNISIFSKAASLAEAIDARIALLQIKSSLKQHSPDDLEGGLRMAVKQRREKDQDSIFYMRFLFDYHVRGRAGEKVRVTTLQRADVNEMLKDRRILLDLAKKGASKEQFDAAHLEMKQRLRSQESAPKQALHQQLVSEVAREMLHRKGKQPVLTLKDGTAKDEAASDPESSDSSSSSSSSS